MLTNNTRSGYFAQDCPQSYFQSLTKTASFSTQEDHYSKIWHESWTMCNISMIERAFITEWEIVFLCSFYFFFKFWLLLKESKSCWNLRSVFSRVLIKKPKKQKWKGLILTVEWTKCSPCLCSVSRFSVSIAKFGFGLSMHFKVVHNFFLLLLLFL